MTTIDNKKPALRARQKQGSACTAQRAPCPPFCLFPAVLVPLTGFSLRGEERALTGFGLRGEERAPAGFSLRGEERAPDGLQSSRERVLTYLCLYRFRGRS